jgi:hypothetical protein
MSYPQPPQQQQWAPGQYPQQPQQYGYPQQPPPPQGVPGWLKAVGVLVVLGVLIGGAVLAFPETRVRVECQGTGDGYTCAVAHDQGRATVNACWDVVATCRNGTRGVGHGCQTVQPSGRASRVIPVGDMVITPTGTVCDVLVGVTVEHLALTEQ